MKSMRQIVTLLFIIFLSSQVYSQISIGGQVSYFNLFGGTGLKNIGLGIKADYARSDRMIISGGLNYYLASKYSDEIYGFAHDSSIDPSQIDIPVEYKVSFIHLYIGGKRYFVGDYEDDFGFYGIVEAGLLLAPVTVNLGSYNSTLYYADQEDGSKETLSNLTLNFGLGIEKDLDFGYIFSDFKFNLPANQANGQSVDVEIPASFSFNVGLRFPF